MFDAFIKVNESSTYTDKFIAIIITASNYTFINGTQMFVGYICYCFMHLNGKIIIWFISFLMKQTIKDLFRGLKQNIPF